MNRPRLLLLDIAERHLQVRVALRGLIECLKSSNSFPKTRISYRQGFLQFLGQTSLQRLFFQGESLTAFPLFELLDLLSDRADRLLVDFDLKK